MATVPPNFTATKWQLDARNAGNSLSPMRIGAAASLHEPLDQPVKKDSHLGILRGNLGFVVGRVTPEACVGDPIALVKNGDPITIDAEKREMTLDIPAAELKKREKAWKKLAPRYTRGVLAKYTAHVTSGSLGAVTDMDLKL